MGGAQVTPTQETGSQYSGMHKTEGEETLQKQKLLPVGVNRMFQLLERRQDMPVAGVKYCEHLFSWAGVARGLVSYRLGLLFEF